MCCSCCKISARYMLAILGCVGLGLIYGLKVNLHVAIVSMVNRTAIGSAQHGSSNSSVPDGPFPWAEDIQGLLLSSYFWGYIVAQVPGGKVAEALSAKWVMLFSVAINVVCSLLTPFMAHIHFGALIAMRIIQGIGGGVTFPAMHVMLAQWAPPSERSVMSSIVYAGTALGTVIFMLVSGLIADAIGWQFVFYIEGGASSLWLFLWLILIADTPQQQRFITQDERDLIIKSLHHENASEKKDHKMPWKAAMTSPAFLAILIAHVCSNWGWYLVLIELPTYMSDMLKFEMSEISILVSLSFLCMWIFSMALSKTLDSLRAKNIISTTAARKIATGLASIIPMVCFLIICYMGNDNKVLVVILFTLTVMSIGGMFCGFLSNHIDIAPNHAGILMAITNTLATLPGICVPIFVGELTKRDETMTSWRIIFSSAIALYIIEIVVYMAFGSGEEQSWNEEPDGQGESQPLKSQAGQSPGKV